VLGEKHGDALVVANPSGVVGAAVGEMRREKRVEAVIKKLALERFKSDFLQDYVAIGVGEDLFVDAVAIFEFGIDEIVGGNSRGERFVFKGAMALFFGEEIFSVSDHESHVASAGLVDARVVDLVKYSVAQREPDFAVLVEGGSDAAFCAGSPPWFNAGPAGGVSGGIVHYS